MESNNQTPHLLAISSFAVHGTASLKTFISVLGSHVLPIPSLMLNGLTNMAAVKKFAMPLAELLESTLELAALRKQQLVFYTGYLGSAGQVEVVMSMIKKYRDIISAVITDPVCGDHGRTYVPTEIVAAWPEIIKLSDIVFPNITELKLITGHAADGTESTSFYVDHFKQLYPGVKLMLSSYATAENEIGIQLHDNDSVFEYGLPMLPQNFGGSGDLLLSLFIKHHFINNTRMEDALMRATIQTHQIIKHTIAKGSDELLLGEFLFNDHISI
jgi:pyridoxine kinase